MTNTLQVQSREGLQSWMEALWQLFLDMSKKEPAGQDFWECCGREGQCDRKQAASAWVWSSSLLSSSSLLPFPPLRPVEALL